MPRLRWTLVSRVRSFSDRRRVYRIERHPETGRLRCSCWAFIYSGGERSCKHLASLSRKRLARIAACA